MTRIAFLNMLQLRQALPTHRTTAMPAPRSPAQIEASRRNGARSCGPVTAEGKARASRNALKHGLAALRHVAVEGEDAAELEGLAARLLAELAPESELEALLVRRMAVAFWQSRAGRANGGGPHRRGAAREA